MFVLESYGKSHWLWEVGEDGLFLAGKGESSASSQHDCWDWEDVVNTFQNGHVTPHEWNVLTESEALLEMI